MTIQVSLTREIQGANVVYQFVADTINKADEMARFLAGATDLTGAYPAKSLKMDNPVKELPKIEKEQAENVKADTGGNKTEKEPEASDTSKTYGYEEVKNLVVAVLKDKGRDTAAACLARVGLKMLPKDCKDAEVLNSLGALAEGVLAGTVDVMAGEAVEG